MEILFWGKSFFILYMIMLITHRVLSVFVWRRCSAKRFGAIVYYDVNRFVTWNVYTHTIRSFFSLKMVLQFIPSGITVSNWRKTGYASKVENGTRIFNHNIFKQNQRHCQPTFSNRSRAHWTWKTFLSSLNDLFYHRINIRSTNQSFTDEASHLIAYEASLATVKRWWQ